MKAGMTPKRLRKARAATQWKEDLAVKMYGEG